MNLNDAQSMAISLIKEHGLSDGSNMEGHGWIFEFDNAKRRFGSCKNPTGKHGRKITLSRHLTELNSEDDVRDTILHEIAHALHWEETREFSHNRKWQKIAVSIGCNGLRCYGSEIVAPEKIWIGTCPSCDRKIERYRIRKTLACGSCCNGKYDEEYKFIWNRK